MELTPQLLQALVLAGLTYGPQIVTDVKNLFSKKDATFDDVETVFANLKPYSAFGIPDVAPVVNTVVVSPIIPMQ